MVAGEVGAATAQDLQHPIVDTHLGLRVNVGEEAIHHQGAEITLLVVTIGTAHHAGRHILMTEHHGTSLVAVTHHHDVEVVEAVGGLPLLWMMDTGVHTPTILTQRRDNLRKMLLHQLILTAVVVEHHHLR